MSKDDQLDRGTRLLVDDLLAKPVSWAREEMLRRARKYRYHDFKSDDALCSITLVKHLKAAGYHDLAQNAADDKYKQQRDAIEEYEQTAEGKEAVAFSETEEGREALTKFFDTLMEAQNRGLFPKRVVVPDDGPPEPGTKGQA